MSAKRIIATNWWIINHINEKLWLQTLKKKQTKKTTTFQLRTVSDLILTPYET